MRNLIVIFLLLLSVLLRTQAQDIQWQKTYGACNDEFGKYVVQTSDGGYIVAGYSTSDNGDVGSNRGLNDVWIVKTSALGEIEWKKTYGGSGDDRAFWIQQTSEGGYIVGCQSSSRDGDVTGNHGNYDYWMLKLNSKGDIEWQKCFGGSDDDEMISIRQTKDGGYICVGYARSSDGDAIGNHGNLDVLIIKVNSTGNIEWKKCYGGSDAESGLDIQQTSEGGYVFVSYSRSSDGDSNVNYGDWDYWIVKLTNTGSITWQKKYGGSAVDAPYAVQQTKDGGYVVVGQSFSNNGDVTGNHGGNDVWVVKLTSTGSLQWQKTLGGSGEEYPLAISQAADEGYVISSYSTSNNGDVSGNHGGLDFWLVRINKTGSAVDWQKSFGGSGEDYPSSMQITKDNGFIISGRSTSKNGDVSKNYGSTDLWLVKVAPKTLLTTDSPTAINFKISPNPANDKLIVEFPDINADKLSITDVAGRIIFSQTLTKGITKAEIPIGSLGNGIWFVSLQESGETLSSQKFVVGK